MSVELFSDYYGFNPIIGGWWILGTIALGIALVALGALWGHLGADGVSEFAFGLGVACIPATLVLLVIWGVGWGANFDTLYKDIKEQASITVISETYSERTFLGTREDGDLVRCTFLTTSRDNHFDLMCAPWTN